MDSSDHDHAKSAIGNPQSKTLTVSISSSSRHQGPDCGRSKALRKVVRPRA